MVKKFWNINLFLIKSKMFLIFWCLQGATVKNCLFIFVLGFGQILEKLCSQCNFYSSTWFYKSKTSDKVQRVGQFQWRQRILEGVLWCTKLIIVYCSLLARDGFTQTTFYKMFDHFSFKTRQYELKEQC